MKYLNELLSNWPFAVWALGLSAVFYFVVAKGSGHLSEDNRARLSLYLEGSYKGSWAENFCDLFDKIFGANHVSFKTFLRSSVASFAAVAAIYALLGPILGLLTVRTTSAMDLFTALAFGALVNIIPDYLSLWETRWMLSTFKRFRNPFVQLGLLILDLAISALIIAIWISGFLFVTGQDQISWVEMVAVYSTYAVFFYSTFLTSLWAWGYCASSWFVKTFTFLQLHKLLDMKAPGKSLAFTGAIAIFAGAFAIKPFASSGVAGWTQFDAQLCAWFPNDACEHAARLTNDQEQKIRLLATRCGGDIDLCLSDAEEMWQTDPKEAVNLFRISCSAGIAVSCTWLGYMYQQARGVPLEEKKAAVLYQKGCEGGNAVGCYNLGVMYEKGNALPLNYGKAQELHRKGCEGGSASACTNLGGMYRDAQGVEQNYPKSVELYGQGCDGGNALGCTNLGWMYENALGVPADFGKAAELYLQGCNGGDPIGCTNLGYMRQKGSGVPKDLTTAVSLYRQACDGGSAVGCTNLGFLYENGRGVEEDFTQAVDLFRQGCVGGAARGCTNLGWMYEKANGVDQDLKRAETLYLQACDMGDDWACEKMETFKDVPK